MARKSRNKGSERIKVAPDAVASAATSGIAAVAQDYNPGAALTIQNAGLVRDDLLTLLAGSGDVRINCAELAAVDTAGLQVLLAFRRSLEAGGRNLIWSGRSQPLLDMARLLGLQDQLADSA
jgi:anti-anti-sigma regulatory factor